jgi:hypothetical protein
MEAAQHHCKLPWWRQLAGSDGEPTANPCPLPAGAGEQQSLDQQRGHMCKVQGHATNRLQDLVHAFWPQRSLYKISDCDRSNERRHAGTLALVHCGAIVQDC